MTIRVVADTHTILWYLYNDPRLSTAATTIMDAVDKAGDQIAIASITALLPGNAAYKKQFALA